MYEHTETDFHQSVRMLHNGNGVQQRLRGTANGMVETGHK